jgi:alpha-mannosidase
VDSQTIRQLIRFSSDSPAVRFRVEGQAAERRTVTVRFGTGLAPSQMAMDAPGGIALRPLQKICAPTFWPAQSFVHLQDSASGRGVALCLAMPGAVACQPDGTLELVALRNATGERAFGFLPLLGMTVSGHEQSRHVCEYALLFTEAGDWRENSVPLMARKLLASPWDSSAHAELRELAASLVTTNRPEVMVTAVKPASRGNGIIVRLYTYAPVGLPVDVNVRGRPLKAAFLCDARERNLEPLQITGQSVRLTMPGAIASVRLLT